MRDTRHVFENNENIFNHIAISSGSRQDDLLRLNEIITNIDIKNEFRYLVALNSSLKELNKEKILSISNESIVREKIKKIELLKNFNEIELDEKYSETLIKNIYLRLNLIT